MAHCLSPTGLCHRQKNQGLEEEQDKVSGEPSVVIVPAGGEELTSSMPPTPGTPGSCHRSRSRRPEKGAITTLGRDGGSCHITPTFTVGTGSCQTDRLSNTSSLSNGHTVVISQLPHCHTVNLSDHCLSGHPTPRRYCPAGVRPPTDDGCRAARPVAAFSGVGPAGGVWGRRGGTGSFR